MNRIIASVVCALLVSGGLGKISVAAEKPEPVELNGKIDWVYDYAQGKRLAAESGKPMFVVFRCER